MATIYSCPRCAQVFSEAHLIANVCPKCGQPFQREQLASIARRTRWTHILLLTFLVGSTAGLGAGLFAAKQLDLKPPFGGYAILGIAVPIIAGVGFLLYRYDRWRNGPMPPKAN